MKKILFVPFFLASLLLAIPSLAMEGVGVINMRDAVLGTPSCTRYFKGFV